jgi:hypothetical protein
MSVINARNSVISEKLNLNAIVSLIRRLRMGHFTLKVLVVIIALAVIGSSSYVLFERHRVEERIRPLVQAGMTKSDAIEFDRVHENWAPYEENEVLYAKNLWPLVTHNRIQENDALSIMQRYPSLLKENNILESDPDNDKIKTEEELFGPDSDILNPTVPNLGYYLAKEKGLSYSLTRKISQVVDNDGKMDSEEENLIELISELPPEQREQYASWALEGGAYDETKKGQTEFLLDPEMRAKAIANPVLLTDPDWDRDNLENPKEKEHGTDPLKFSTADDNIPDGWKVNYGLDPLDPKLGSKESPDNSGWLIGEEYQMGTDPNDFFSPPQWKPLNVDNLKQLQIDYLERMKAQPVDRRYNPYIPELLDEVRRVDASDPYKAVIEISNIIRNYVFSNNLGLGCTEIANVQMYTLLDAQIRNFDRSYWSRIQFYPVNCSLRGPGGTFGHTSFIFSIPVNGSMKPYVKDIAVDVEKEYSFDPNDEFEFDFETAGVGWFPDPRLGALMSNYTNQFDTTAGYPGVGSGYPPGRVLGNTSLTLLALDKLKKLPHLTSEEIYELKGMLLRYHKFRPEDSPALIIDMENDKLTYKPSKT